MDRIPTPSKSRTVHEVWIGCAAFHEHAGYNSQLRRFRQGKYHATYNHPLSLDDEICQKTFLGCYSGYCIDIDFAQTLKIDGSPVLLLTSLHVEAYLISFVIKSWIKFVDERIFLIDPSFDKLIEVNLLSPLFAFRKHCKRFGNIEFPSPQESHLHAHPVSNCISSSYSIMPMPRGTRVTSSSLWTNPACPSCCCKSFNF